MSAEKEGGRKTRWTAVHYFDAESIDYCKADLQRAYWGFRNRAGGREARLLETDCVMEPIRIAHEKMRAEDREIARISARLAAQFTLRILSLLSAVAQGDNILGIVFIAIVAANTAHIDRNLDDASPFRGIDQAPPDDQRRPISRMAIAATLGLPDETARRYVNRLVQMGLCKVVKGGVIVPAEVVQRAFVEDCTISAVADIRKFVKSLRAAGLDFD